MGAPARSCMLGLPCSHCPVHTAVSEELRFAVTGNGFLYNMVRIMVGTLLEVGRHERPADSIGQLYGEKREKAGPLVPAQGLCLMEVDY